MRRRSELEQYLAAQQRDGTFQSAGRFTLSREEALRKLGAYRLPFENAWVLKMVQSAVACGATRLRIKQTVTDTCFQFCCPATWTLEVVEQAFLDPGPSGEAGSLVWCGRTVERIPARGGSELLLTVSHRKLSEGSGVPVLREFEAVRRNAQVLHLLGQRAFVCPIPLAVDGRRLDVLQFCPDHGLSDRTHPVALAWVEGSDPGFLMPPGSFEARIVQAQQQGMKELSASVVSLPKRPLAPVSAAVLLSAHVETGVGGTWRTTKLSSHIFWVDDGVVIEKAPICQPRRCVLAAVFAPASGLKRDLTGFALLANSDRQTRAQRTLASVGAPIEALDPIALSTFFEETKRGMTRTRGGPSLRGSRGDVRLARTRPGGPWSGRLHAGVREMQRVGEGPRGRSRKRRPARNGTPPAHAPGRQPTGPPKINPEHSFAKRGPRR